MLRCASIAGYCLLSFGTRDAVCQHCWLLLGAVVTKDAVCQHCWLLLGAVGTRKVVYHHCWLMHRNNLGSNFLEYIYIYIVCKYIYIYIYIYLFIYLLIYMPYCKFYKTKFIYYSLYVEFLFTIYGMIVFIVIA